MATDNYYFSFKSLFLGRCLLLITAQLFLHVSSNAKAGFFVDIIHRDSPESPLHNSSSTSFSRLHAAVQRSASRADYIRRAHFPDFVAPPPGPLQDGLSASLTNYDFDFLMIFYLGSKRKEVFAGIDTGSGLIWVLCNPCVKCYHHIPTIFNPTSSKRYKQLKCGVHPCTLLPNTACNEKNKCQYTTEYLDQSHVKGILSTDTLGFNFVADKRIYDVHKIIFGCTHRTKGDFEEGGIGLVGLNRGPLSLLSQLGTSFGRRFSYCLPSEIDHRSRLYFGTAAIVSGPGVMTTPLFQYINKQNYYLSLETIIIEKVSIVATRTQDNLQGNIVIDSGASLTYIESMQEVSDKVKMLISLPVKHEEDYDLCFDISGISKIQVPAITFRFVGGAELVLTTTSAFGKINDNTLCLLILSTTHSGGTQIIGNRAQMGYRIGFDIDNDMLSILEENC